MSLSSSSPITHQNIAIIANSIFGYECASEIYRQNKNNIHFVWDNYSWHLKKDHYFHSAFIRPLSESTLPHEALEANDIDFIFNSKQKLSLKDIQKNNEVPYSNKQLNLLLQACFISVVGNDHLNLNQSESPYPRMNRFPRNPTISNQNFKLYIYSYRACINHYLSQKELLPYDNYVYEKAEVDALEPALFFAAPLKPKKYQKIVFIGEQTEEETQQKSYIQSYGQKVLTNTVPSLKKCSYFIQDFCSDQEVSFQFHSIMHNQLVIRVLCLPIDDDYSWLQIDRFIMDKDLKQSSLNTDFLNEFCPQLKEQEIKLISLKNYDGILDSVQKNSKSLGPYSYLFQKSAYWKTININTKEFTLLNKNKD